MFQGNDTKVDVHKLVLDKELQDRSSVFTCVQCVSTIASTVTTCALAGDAYAVVACVQDEIGSTISAPFEVVPYTEEPICYHCWTPYPPRIKRSLFNIPTSPMKIFLLNS